MSIECKNCCYYWEEDTDQYECCHWADDSYNVAFGVPPCEEDDYEQYYDPDPEYYEYEPYDN